MLKQLIPKSKKIALILEDNCRQILPLWTRKIIRVRFSSPHNCNPIVAICQNLDLMMDYDDREKQAPGDAEKIIPCVKLRTASYLFSIREIQ
ncbi:MAG: hypothetical protein ACKVOU_01050 [Cytophagales bacterium]